METNQQLVKPVLISFLAGAMSIIFAYGAIFAATSAQALPLQDMKSSLFTNAGQALKQAKKIKADILAPKAFSEGLELYRKAQADFDKGKSLADIRKNLRNATNRFEKAIEATKVANVAFGTSIKARADALSAEAPNYSAKIWQEAEGKFTDAARTLEGGDLKDAKKKAGEAEKLFRDAELKAIKVNYLDETYTLLKEAERMKIREFAPNTLKKAQDLVKAAEAELTENRYDTDKARILARQAKREAKHAMYLGLAIKDMREKKQNWEDLMLNAEKPLMRIAASMDMILSFEDGFRKPTDDIVKNITDYQKNVANLTTDLFDSRQLNALFEQRNAELLEKLGDVEVAKSALAQRLEAEARIQALYDEVEKLFTGEVAIFIRQGHDMIIRTVGLSFPVGKSTIDPKYYEFLARVGKAIGMFPNSTIAVEGHTDSYGSDETNLKLSIERAEAVKAYLSSNINIDPSRIESIGYGESRPVATNETDEGRARNRRIEIVIHPNIEDGT